LLLGVGIVGYFDELFDIGWVNFFIFGSYQHRCNANELIVFSFHLDIFSKSIYQLGGDEECFWQKLEIGMDFNEPMHQDLSHPVHDFFLAF